MTQPDFLLIPKVVRDHPRLQPADWLVYAVIYWYEHMAEGRCTASNESIGLIAGVADRTVRSALDKLEQAGFIERKFSDKERTNRVEIRGMVRFAVVRPEGEPVSKNQMTLLGERAPTKETPGEFAKRFFSGDENAKREIVEELMLHSHGRIPEEPLRKEIQKFCTYWTEPNKSGTKEKWQLGQTFEIRRRLYTWLARASVRGGARSGAGVEV